LSFPRLIISLIILLGGLGLASFLTRWPERLWIEPDQTAMARADELVVAGAPIQARQAYEEFIRNRPDSPHLPSILLKMAQVDHLHLHEYERALAAYRHLVRLFPQSPQAPLALERMAEIYLAGLKDYERAIEIYNRLGTDYGGKNLKGDFYRERIAHCYFMAEKYVKARAAYRKLIKEYPASPLVESSLVRLADSYYVEDRIEEALQAYRKIQDRLKDEQLKNRVKFRIANCLEELGRLKEAVVHYKALLNTYDNPEAVRIRLVGVQERIKKGAK
jgi:tetratricopeptide (TPR) repeat protein